MKDPARFFSRALTVALAAAIVLSLALLARPALDLRGSGNDQGHSPEQPIAYSHRLHAGELSIPCLYCHFAAEKSRSAGIPPLSVCMNCHARVTAPFIDVRAEDAAAAKEKRKPRVLMSEEIRKIYDALGLASDGTPSPGRTPSPVRWNRVHNVPDFVAFDHRPHVAAGLTCQTCHGPVETMEKMRQHSDLSMGWCVNCHRRTKPAGADRHASTDCGTCHY